MCSHRIVNTNPTPKQYVLTTLCIVFEGCDTSKFCNLHLFDLTKQYADSKAGRWLARRKAKNCGYQAEPPPKAPKSKGKPKQSRRTVSKKAAASNSQYVVKIRDFVPMAASIAVHKPRIKVPRALAPMINRVVDLRRECTSFYKGSEEST
jgi:hypothetical protein